MTATALVLILASAFLHAAWNLIGKRGRMTLPLVAFLATAGAVAAAPTVGPGDIEAGFRDPPPSAKPHTWYHLMNGNITAEGITRDFEALAEAGIGGATLIDVASGVPQGDVDFNSEAWFDLVEHAASEARRLGLELCLENCSGWSAAGGPWVTPDLAMKSLVWTKTRTVGPAQFSGVLPRTTADNGFYRDIAVLAFPTPAAELAGNPLRIAEHAKKIFAERDKNDFRYDTLAKTPEAAEGQAIGRTAVVDISSAMAEDGRLNWQVPDGDWTILRFGYICNGASNHPATSQGVGLEIDKLSAAAAEAHFNRYMARICDRLGPLAGNVSSGLNAVLIDSHEVGCQNWTDGFEASFEEITGYPLRPWMPVLAGRVVGDSEASERFLEDFRRVIADLFAKNYAGRYAKMCHERGLQLQIEPYGNCPSDDLQFGGAADVPMAEFWSRASLGDHSVDTRNSRLAAHLAHVWGRRIAAAEAFTGDPAVGSRWLTTPFTIKAQGDRAYANGINRVVYHRFVHQPWTNPDRLPGMTMGKYGMHFDRTQTWWHLVGPWLLYQTRCQWMLQEGTFCADVLYYCGEEAPNGTGYDSQPLAGHGWDVCVTEALEALEVAGGRIVAPGGVSYALLVLPSCEFASARVLNAVERLLDAGARVCCEQRPTRAYGAPGQSGADDAVIAAVARIWAKGVMECAPAEALLRLGIEPDFRVAEAARRAGATFIHRRDDSADWYFVALNNEETIEFEASFRETGRVPEIWNAETGEIAEAALRRVESGRTTVALSLPPSGSAFVVFRRDVGAASASGLSGETRLSSIPVSVPWRVEFPVDWYSGGSTVKTRNWSELNDWTSDDDPDIRFFSGTATYKCTMHNAQCTIDAQCTNGGRVVLDLGDVKNFAVVTVNGRVFPPLWRPPFRVDITDAIEPGGSEMDVRIEITNLWPNRLIGDDFMEDDCSWRSGNNGDRRDGLWSIPDWVKRGEPSPTGRHTFTTWRHWTKDDAPLPSGLLGPVTLVVPDNGAGSGDDPVPLAENEYEVYVPFGRTRIIGAALVDDIGAKNLVKTGRGKLIGSDAMADYDGTIIVREGAFVVTTTSDLGTANGGTVIEDGGTLVVELSGSSQSFGNEPFIIGGTGDAAYRAAVYHATGRSDQNKLFKNLTISGDATIYAGTRLGLDYGTLTMNGHTLTIKGSEFVFRADSFPAPIGCIVAESNVRFQNEIRDITADPSKTFTIRNGGTLNFAGANTPPSFWTLAVEEGGRIASYLVETAQWNGDVIWNSTAADAITGVISFNGNVSGTGTIKTSSGTLTFAKSSGANVGLGLSGTATAILKGSSYSHKGMMTGFRADDWMAGYDSDRADTQWSHCDFGPGPQLTRAVYWDGTFTPNSGKAGAWCSRGYIWNREATNVTYTIFVGCVYQTWVRIDGVEVYSNKRSTWGNTYSFEMPAGACRSIDIRTVGSTSESSGPRNDNDKFKINGVIANDQTGWFFTTNAVSTLENTPALAALALADDGALDANNMPVSVGALSGAGLVTNVTALMVADSWTLAAADIEGGAALVVDGALVFGTGCAFAVTDLQSLPISSTYTIATADSITGFAGGTQLLDGDRVWRLNLSGDGKSITAENVEGAVGGDCVVFVPYGETRTIDADFVAALGSMNLVKTGRGTLVSSNVMSNYTGTITIREGAFEIKTTDDLGTADGGTVVEDGGTLVVQMDSGQERFPNEQFTIAGTGDATYGAAIYQTRSNDRFKLFKYLALSGDATIYAGTRLGVDGGTLAMNGHTLAVKGANFQLRDVTYAPPIGNLVVEANVAFVRNQTATADATKTLTVRGGGRIGFAEAYTTPSFWTLVVEDGGKVASSATAACTWGGDVVWNATTEDGVSGLLVLGGSLSGVGVVGMSDGTLTLAKAPAATIGFAVSGTASVVLPPARAYSYEHKGLLTGYRRDGWPAGFDSDRNDTQWSYCPFGPGPQIDRSFWGEGNGQKEVWCSRGYLWNREATNIMVQFFIGNVYQSWVYLDGTCVYDNKRDNWVASSEFEIPSGTCRSFEVRTSDGGASSFGGPRNDNDKLKINGVIANDPTGWFFTTNALSGAENAPTLAVLALAGDGAIDAKNMPLSVNALSGAGLVTNVTTLTIEDSWMLAAADIAAGATLIVDGDIVLGAGCAFNVSGLGALPVFETYTICRANSFDGLADGTSIRDGNRIWKISIPGDGTAKLVSLPIMTLFELM